MDRLWNPRRLAHVGWRLAPKGRMLARFRTPTCSRLSCSRQKAPVVSYRITVTRDDGDIAGDESRGNGVSGVWSQAQDRRHPGNPCLVGTVRAAAQPMEPCRPGAVCAGTGELVHGSVLAPIPLREAAETYRKEGLGRVLLSLARAGAGIGQEPAANAPPPSARVCLLYTSPSPRDS